MIQARFLIRRGAFTLDVDFELEAQGVTAVFGPSGCGKTTLLRAIAGLEKAEGGLFRIGDKTWQEGDNFRPVHKRSLGYVFQEASLFPHLSVRENLDYGLKRTPLSERKVSFERAVELLGLSELLERRPEKLSGGERQRVAIARALLSSPELLLMDEPLAALDLQSKKAILPFLKRLHRELNIPVIYVSHSADEVAQLADRLLLMDAGRVIASGAVNELLTDLQLPPALRSDAEALIEAEVQSYDEKYQLLTMVFPGGTFCVTGEVLPLGQKLRVRILARDVSLTRERQEGTSILNIIPVKVSSLKADGKAQVVARLDAGGVPLLSRITRKSADLLGLEEGSELFAQVKGVSILN
jgi:molybdate transport system ATP-binding protein